MRKAFYIHRAPSRKDLVNIIMEEWPKEGLTEEQEEEEARALRSWMGEYLPGSIFDKVFGNELVKESPGRIDIPINRVENLPDLQSGNFTIRLLLPAPLPIRDERRVIIGHRENPGPIRLEITLGEKDLEGEGSEDRLYNAAVALLAYWKESGPDNFRKRFASKLSPELLATCRKIVTEGEGNPHPWE